MQKLGTLHGLLATASLAALVANTPAASAATLINGGGSTLAQIVYQQAFLNFRAANPTATFFYCGVGSGKGQAGFIGNDPSQLVISAPKPPNSAQCATQQPKPVFFGASDAQLSSTQISTYDATRPATDGALIQIPTFGTAISVPVNNPAATSNTAITFTDKQLCYLYSGKVTTWNNAILSGSGATGSSTIQIIYRADNSGTSFLLTQHLAKVCPTQAPGLGFTFTATQSFASLFGGTVPNGVPATGSGGVQAALVGGSHPSAIAYLSPDYTSQAPNALNGNPKVHTAQVRNAHNGTAYQPNSSATQAALGTAPLPSDQTNPALWVPQVPDPTTGYPIVGYTTWELATCYSNTTAAGFIRSFITDWYTNSSYQSIVTNNAFANVPSNYATAINADFATGAGQSGKLKIQGGLACAGKSGRGNN